MTSVVPDVTRLAHEFLDQAQKGNSHQDDAPPAVADKLKELLIADGWKINTNNLSICSVAIKEHHLIKGSTRLNIVASFFAGFFVQMDVWR